MKQSTSIQTQDIRAYRGEECRTDHYLVKASFFPWQKKQPIIAEQLDKISNQPEHFNIELLQDESIREFYKQRMDRELDEEFGQTVEEIYNYIKNTTKKIALEAIGTKGEKNKLNQLPMEIKLKLEGEKRGIQVVTI